MATPQAISTFSTLKSPSSGIASSRGAAGQRDARARPVHPHVGRLETHLCVGDARDADHARAGAARRERELGAGGVVDVHDGAARLRQVAREEQRLRVAVGRHRAVEVEVILGEIREGADAEATAVDASRAESPCEDTSITTASAPRLRMSRSAVWRSRLSGVVLIERRRWPAKRASSVPISPTRRPARPRIDSIR